MLFKLYRRLLPFAHPFRSKMILSSLMNIISNAIGSVNLLALLPIVSVVLGEPNIAGTPSTGILQKFTNFFLVHGPSGLLDRIASLERICAFVFVTYLLKNVFQYSAGYIMSLVESGMARSIRDAVFEKLSTLSLDYYYDRKSGQLLSRLTNDVGVVNGTLASGILTIVGQPVQIIIFISTMLVISPKMTAISVTIAALSLY
ncbi:MAG TPA: ABC transporter transmembrane domain-containing protein, partial [Candidatus Kapabacteria bacterium]